MNTVSSLRAGQVFFMVISVISACGTDSPQSEVQPVLVRIEVTGRAQRTLSATEQGYCQAWAGVCDLTVVLWKENEPE